MSRELISVCVIGVSLSRLERDVSHKRVLLDDIKLKLAEAQQAAETDADVMVWPAAVYSCFSLTWKVMELKGKRKSGNYT